MAQAVGAAKTAHVVALVQLEGTADVFDNLQADTNGDHPSRVLHLVRQMLHIAVIGNRHLVVVANLCFFLDLRIECSQALTDGSDSRGTITVAAKKKSQLEPAAFCG